MSREELGEFIHVGTRAARSDVGETALFSLKDACRIARDRGAAVIGTDHVVLAIVQAPIMKDAMWQMTETVAFFG